MGIFIAVVIIVAMLTIAFYKMIFIGSVKILSLLPDFFVVFFYGAYYANEWISKPFATGGWVYAINITVAILMCLLYAMLMIFLMVSVPKIATAINYIIVFMGVMVALPFALGLLQPIFSGFGHPLKTTKVLLFTKNNNINLFIHYALIGLLAIPIAMKRVKFLNNED